MEKCLKYLYKIDLSGAGDVLEFSKVATRFKGRLYLVNGNKRLNAKSFLGVQLAKISWNEIHLESDENCFFEFRRFIVK